MGAPSLSRGLHRLSTRAPDRPHRRGCNLAAPPPPLFHTLPSRWECAARGVAAAAAAAAGLQQRQARPPRCAPLQPLPPPPTTSCTGATMLLGQQGVVGGGDSGGRLERPPLIVCEGLPRCLPPSSAPSEQSHLFSAQLRRLSHAPPRTPAGCDAAVAVRSRPAQGSCRLGSTMP